MITTFLRKKAFETLMEKEKMLVPTFSPSPTMLSIRSYTHFKFRVTSIFLSATDFNLDESKILSFGKGLK